MSILVATDFSDNATAALHAGAYLANQQGVGLTLIHCLEWEADAPEDLSEEGGPDYREQVLEKLRGQVDESLAGEERPEQIDYEVAAGHPDTEIVSAVEAAGHELVVLGATGMGRVANLLLGSVPEAVVRRSPVPVLVVPPEIEAGGYHHIVAPVDFTDCSRASLELAVELAREHDAALTVAHAAPHAAQMGPTPFPPSAPVDSEGDARERARSRLETFLEEVSLEGLEVELSVELGSPRKLIEETVEEVGGDLVVMGTHGRRGAERLFLGSTATKVLRTMPCAVMTVRDRNA